MNQKLKLIGILILVFVGIVFVSGCTRGASTKVDGLTDEDIKIELKNLEKINAHPDNKNIDPKDYPKVLGVYSKNGINLIERYFCSDVCPDAGGVSIVFEGIGSKEKCEEVGGKVLIDFAWKGYRGCEPDIE